MLEGLIIEPLETDDDGCSDGRDTVEVYDQYGKIEGGLLDRAKVFGGSVVITAASLIGLGRAHSKPMKRKSTQ
jgi:hypothetical protein